MRADEFTRKAQRNSKIYLDMDGVLANFFAEYAKLADVESYRDIPAAKVDPILNSLIGTDFFARLPKFPTADQLVKLAIKHAGSYSICSSPLRKDYSNSAYWKKIWIRAYLNPQPLSIEITPEKDQHAMSGDVPNILIDDKGSNIREWIEAGGIGIKYQADEDPLSKVADALEHIYCDVEKTCGTDEIKEDEFNKCYDYAEQLYTRAKQKGLDAELVQVAGYQGDDSKADERWKEIPKKYWKHYVVKMGTTVLDPSASQFNPNAETKYPERTLNKMWDEQYVIKEMSHQDAVKQLKKHHYHLDRQRGGHDVYKDEEGHTFALPHKHHGKDLSKGVEHSLKKEITHENFADGANNITYKQQKGKNKFSVEMSVDGKSAGVFQYDANTGRTITELDPAYRGQGLGQRLILKGIYTAAMLGMDYVEDESRTQAFNNAMDSLADAGYIVNDDEYWYVTDRGEQFVKQGVSENFADGKVKGKSRPGRVKRSGASCKGSVTDLRARAKKASGEKAKMYHWCANMKAGKKG